MDETEESGAMKPVYLDYNATTPIDTEVADAMLPFLRDHYGNPSSLYAYGTSAREAVDRARTQVADLLHCSPREVIFTSGGTESNNFAIKGTAWANRDRGNHIITSRVEHPAVEECFRYLEQQGFEASYISVDDTGRIDVKELRNAIRPDTILISVMHANNEVGTIEPLEEIAAIARDRGITFHTDAAQSVGKIPTDVEQLGIDLLSVAGHKVYAPKGIGALYVREGRVLEKFMHGAGHEGNMRPGTENVLEIVGLGKACEIARRDLAQNMTHMRAMRDRLHEGLVEAGHDMRLNGHPDERLPNTLSIGFKGMEALTLLSHMDGVFASTGSACHEGSPTVSGVLAALRVPFAYARGTLRLSTGRLTTKEEIDRVLAAIDTAIHTIQ